jgi:ankyrin repeat protein/cellobiose-specific phosphotransferase system component IIA
MPKALSLILSLLIGLSCGLVALGGLALLGNTLLAGVILLVTAALFLAAFRLGLPYWAKHTSTRGQAFLYALATASVVNGFGFLMLVGVSRKSDVGTSWIADSWLPGLLLALLAWAGSQYVLYAKQKVGRQHYQSVTEAHRLLELDAPKDAEDKLKESLLNTEVNCGSRSLLAAEAAADLGRFYLKSGERSKAAAMFRRALRVREELLGEEDATVSSTLMEWVGADDRLEAADAVKHLHKSLLIMEKQVGPYSAPAALAYERVGELHFLQNQLSEAEAALRRSHSILKKLETQQTAKDQYRVGMRLARCYISMSKFKEAQEIVQELEAQQSSQDPEMQLQVLRLQMQLHDSKNDSQASSERAWQALQLLQRDLGPTHPEFKAIWEGCLERLSAPYADPAARNMFMAIFSGDSMTVKQGLQAHLGWHSLLDGSGWTFLQWACFFGHDRVVDALIAAGASAEGNKDEWPPLHIACRWAHRRLISNLAPKVSSLDQPAAGGWRPIHRCAQNGDDRLLEVLTSKELDVDAANDRGETPLLITCRQGLYRFVVTLVARGADVNKVNPTSGRSPLHEAAYVGHRAIAECLLLNGAKLDAQDRAGLTPVELAAQAEQEAMVKQLQESAKGLKD